MADDRRHNSESSPSPIAPAGRADLEEPPKKLPKRLPKGLVLGKDGKPCRSCSSFSAWKQAASSMKKEAQIRPTGADDCPPDVEALGRGSWALLHSIAAQYPDKPTWTDQENIRNFMSLFATLYPCWVCGEEFSTYQSRRPVPTESRDAFGTWLCAAHNDVNRRLGKPEFDCSKWEERWRTGWKDGRCD